MTLPKENLDNKVFSDLVKEAISRIPVYAPEWTDHNIHDPGITFIELFAWLTEMQIYRLNRTSDKNYRKFLKLIGIPKLKPANAAKVNVTFSLKPGFIYAEVPAGTIVAATDSVTGEDILFETEQDLKVVNIENEEIVVLSLKAKADESAANEGEDYINNTEANKNDSLYYYAFRPEEQPKRGDELYIGFKADPGAEIVLAFYLQDNKPLKAEENSVLVPSGRLDWHYYNANTTLNMEGWRKVENSEITDETRHFSVSGIVRIKIASKLEKKDIGENRGLFWVKCSVTDEKGYHIPPKINRILLNTVPAVHAIHQNEIKPSSSGLPDFCIDLEHVPVLDTTEPNKKLTVNLIEEWTEVEDFDASKPGDQHYIVNFASGKVAFGNGINGKIPPKGKENIRVSYCSGGGLRGNIKARAITRILDISLNERVKVTNIETASGGTEAETLEEAIQRARSELKKVTRAVTSVDYEYLALNTPGLRVARVKALPRYHPSQDREVPGIISVIVVPESPYSNPIPSENFLKAVYKHLDEHRLLTTELFVLQPVYVEVSVRAEVVVKPKSLPAQVKEAIENKLEKFLHPVSGGIDGKGWPFGRSVYISEVYELIDGVEGVNYVESVTLSGNHKTGKESFDIPPTVTKSISIPAEGLVYLDLVKTEIVAREET